MSRICPNCTVEAEKMRAMAADVVRHGSHEDGMGMGSQRLENAIMRLPLPKIVTTVRALWMSGHFKSEDEARGAFEYAENQGQEGMGDAGARDWMGLTRDEWNSWKHSRTLPARDS